MTCQRPGTAWSKDVDKQAAYLQEIHKCYPGLEAHATRLIETGEFNDAFILDDRFVFRFPRSPEGVDRLSVEIEVLRAIRGHVCVPVPNPIFVGADRQAVGTAFMGYHMLPGVPLRNCLDAFKADNAHPRLATQLARFLRELHSFPVQASGLELPAHDRVRPEALPGLYQIIRASLYTHMRADARDLIADQFHSYLDDPASHRYQQVLRHGDLGPGNVLVMPETHEIGGVIDFGSTGLDDPALDLGVVSFWGASLLGSAFVERLYDSYAVTERLLNRIRFFAMLSALMVALEGLEKGDRQAFAFGLAKYA
jgi:aminoglycoside 2''-phosphotransferase